MQQLPNHLFCCLHITSTAFITSASFTETPQFSFPGLHLFFFSLSHLHTLPHTQKTGLNYYVASSCTSLDIMAAETLLTVLVMDAAKLELAPKQKNTRKSYLRSCSTSGNNELIPHRSGLSFLFSWEHKYLPETFGNPH